jgi:Flp pilus assembly protein TadD
VKLLDVAQAQAPNDPQVLLLMGNAQLRAGHAAEASALLQRAADLAPQDPRVLGQLAVSHLATGHPRLAGGGDRGGRGIGLMPQRT